MTDFTTAAAAFLILTGQVPSAPPPPGTRTIACQLPNPPPRGCPTGWDHDCRAQLTMDMSPQAPRPAHHDRGNHLSVRWVGDRHEKGRPGEHQPRPPHLDHHPRHHHGYRGLWE